MDWTEIRVTTAAGDIARASDIALMTVPYGIYIEDYSALEAEVMEIARIDLIEDELLARPRDIGIIHIYIPPEGSPNEAVDFLRERLTAEGIAHTIGMDSAPDEDWLNNWKKYFKPIPVGNRLLIRPIWEEVSENPDNRIVLDLEPGLAFGTGTHETTRLCMELLEEAVHPGCSVLDIGCGSGILSVAAILLGADTAVGIDIDPAAVKTAKENARLNKADGKFTAIQGNLTDNAYGQFDIIVSNIVADAIIALSATVQNFMKPGAIWIISGIIEPRLPDVTAALSGSFTPTKTLLENGWIAQAFVRT